MTWLAAPPGSAGPPQSSCQAPPPCSGHSSTGNPPILAQWGQRASPPWPLLVLGPPACVLSPPQMKLWAQVSALFAPPPVTTLSTPLPTHLAPSQRQTQPSAGRQKRAFIKEEKPEKLSDPCCFPLPSPFQLRLPPQETHPALPEKVTGGIRCLLPL